MATTMISAIETMPAAETTTALGRPSRTSPRRSPGVVRSMAK